MNVQRIKGMVATGIACVLAIINIRKVSLVCAVAAACFGIAEVTHGATLIGHWTFDTDLTDSVGINDGTAVGDASAGAAGAIIGDGAAVFDGTGDAIYINKSVIPDGTFTIAFWEKAVSGNVGYLVAAGADIGFEDMFFRWVSTTKYSGSFYNATFTFGQSSGAYPQEQWHHIALTQDTLNNVTLYVDGQIMPSTEDNPKAGSPFTGLNGNLYLGNRKELWRPFAGLIDDLRIYDNELSQSEVQALVSVAPAELVGHWTFDTDLTDSVGSNNGTAVGDASAGAAGAIIGKGAATFDGTSDAIYIDKSVMYDGTFTIAFWEKAVSGNVGYLVAAGTGEGYEDMFLRWASTTTYNGALNNATFDLGVSSVAYTQDKWHHIALTQDLSNNVTLYVDGEIMPSTVDNPKGGSTFTGLNGNLYVGNRKDLWRPFSGLIDDLRVYDKALTQTEIQALKPLPTGTLIIIE